MSSENHDQEAEQVITVMVADGPLLSSSMLVMFLNDAEGIEVVALAENKDEGVALLSGRS